MGTTISWEFYIRRRKHKPVLYVKNTGITIYTEFVDYMRAKGVAPPTQEQFNSYVGNPPVSAVLPSPNKENPSLSKSKSITRDASPTPKVPKKSKPSSKTSNVRSLPGPAKSSPAPTEQIPAPSVTVKWKDYLRQAKLSASDVVEKNGLTTYKKFQEFLISNSIEDVPFNAYNSYIFTITQQLALKKKEPQVQESSRSFQAQKKRKNGNKK
jgi:hypothetical protein